MQMEKREKGVSEEEISGYDCSESVDSLKKSKEMLTLLMKDIMWRSNQRDIITSEEYRHYNIQIALNHPISSNTLFLPNESRKHSLDQPDILLKDYLSGNLSSYDSTMSNNTKELLSLIPSLQPPPSQIRFIIHTSTNHLPTHTFSLTSHYYDLVNQTLFPYPLLSQQQHKIIHSHIPIFSDLKVSENPFVKKKYHLIPTLSPSNVIDWVVEITGKDFLQRRYLFLCSLKELKLNDYTSIALTSLDKPNLTRRCIIFSDLAELNMLNLQTLFAKLVTITPENVFIFIKFIFTNDKFIQTRQEYMTMGIIDSGLDEDEEISEEEGKRKVTKKSRKKAKKTKSKKIIEDKKRIERQKEREKRLNEFKKKEEENEDYSLTLVCKECQIKTEKFLNDLHEMKENESPIKQMIEHQDWYHFVNVAIELLHPSMVKKRKEECNEVLEELIQNVSMIFYHPKIMNLIICCYSIIKKNDCEIHLKRRATILIALLLDYIDTPKGVLVRAKNYLNKTMQEINELIPNSEMIIDTSFINEDYSIFIQQVSQITDEILKAKIILTTLINTLNKNISSFDKFFQSCSELIPLIPLPVFVCKQMVGNVVLNMNNMNQIVSLIKVGIISIGTVLKHFIQPTLKHLIINKDKERMMIIMKMITNLMKLTNTNGGKIWNIKMSEIIFEESVYGLEVLNENEVQEVFDESFGGNLNEFMNIHPELVNKLIKKQYKTKIVSGLCKKPNNICKGEGLEKEYLIKCSFPTLSLILNVISIEKCIDALMYVMLIHTYSFNQFKEFIKSIEPITFQSERFKTISLSLLFFVVQHPNQKKDFNAFIQSQLAQWYVNTYSIGIECSANTIDGFFQILHQLIMYHNNLEIVQTVISFLSLPIFAKEEIGIINDIILDLCKNSKSLNEVNSLINGLQMCLLKFNQPLSTTDLQLLNIVIETTSQIFSKSLQFNDGNDSLKSFKQFIDTSSIPFSLKRYLSSQLPVLEQFNILPPQFVESKYYTKKQPTYSNLIGLPTIVHFKYPTVK
ncbi:hypothetical protein CL6EHI_036590 [Entamoeba histolytica]|uniref:Uncharacterized protein n=3 Tax=Entamoeba histolytica TaxID=5759 RepID=C4M8G1_ENTH1|nr:hypothetical protein EHI_036590 [Entamoeba histolytica HM-1:IMSS]EAL46179.2 hypothetical protein EHI_036590 [Entamoeba histolytica HM-1:IMSS]ENY60855.1 hypothetical protein EHI7A_028760 [Entamoeba histolytica HM-1:IMSS-A]GAT97885.1 hypothetical protein CL6EHI_036590 [Entamoeba histolytica]|eukprot:XP_651565.2 hypothetical protein EHI_036590 [Entamoeba histolytica HM-1:IMSS]